MFLQLFGFHFLVVASHKRRGYYAKIDVTRIIQFSGPVKIQQSLSGITELNPGSKENLWVVAWFATLQTCEAN